MLKNKYKSVWYERFMRIAKAIDKGDKVGTLQAVYEALNDSSAFGYEWLAIKGYEALEQVIEDSDYQFFNCGRCGSKISKYPCWTCGDDEYKELQEEMGGGQNGR